MKTALKLMSAAALVAATSTAAVANDVPLNTTVQGGQGNEQVAGQVEGGVVVLNAMAVVAGLTALALIGAGSEDDTE